MPCKPGVAVLSRAAGSVDERPDSSEGGVYMYTQRRADCGTAKAMAGRKTGREKEKGRLSQYRTVLLGDIRSAAVDPTPC